MLEPTNYETDYMYMCLLKATFNPNKKNDYGLTLQCGTLISFRSERAINQCSYKFYRLEHIFIIV